MIAMKFPIELDIGLSVLLQAALPQLVTVRGRRRILFWDDGAQIMH